MKKILVVSDTHYDTSHISKVNDMAGPFDAAIHLGDCTGDTRAVEEALQIPCVSVRGNCDSDYSVPDETVVEYEGVRLLCLHGHRCHDPAILSYKAEQENCVATLHGHTHTPYCKQFGRVWVVNPGSLSCPRYGSDAGFCVLYIENGELFIRQFSID